MAKRTRRRDESAPKTTRPEAAERREPEPIRSTQEAIGRTLDAAPDRIDVRDWFYQPGLRRLPDVLVNCDSVQDVLDQGKEGACTGYALAGVINYLLGQRNIRTKRVSPRMLYEMARRYDEWPGEDYVGSSARGAMIGWARHGVCQNDLWPASKKGFDGFTPDIVNAARAVPGGAFYRVMHKQVRDMHAALADVGILYCTLMVHRGWADPGPKKVVITYVDSDNLCSRELPVIQRQGTADGGHAVAIVGYTADGFIILNSWGPAWEAGGFALLPYEDYLLHATDVWVAQLGVPVRADLWVDAKAADSAAGLHRAQEAIPLDRIRPFVVDIGNNGVLSDSGDYWTSEADVERLFSEIIPKQTKDWKKRRVLLYLHGGLNDELTSARRIIAFKEVMLANEIYPLHIMWESGALETLNQILENLITRPDERAGGVGDWMKKLRDGLIEAKDRTLELSIAKPGTALWNKMKENARLASERSDKSGAMEIIAEKVTKAMANLSAADRNNWELHVVGHSAGSIFVARALPLLVNLGIPFKTLQFMAPAVTVELFKGTIVKAVNKGVCPHPSLFVLSDVGELDDNVGNAYGKSLLYLVSNSFEGAWGVPLLGMEKFISNRGVQPSPAVDPDMNAFFKRQVNGRPSLVIAGEKSPDDASLSRSETHGGFDNDEWTMNSVLHRILGATPNPPFTQRDMQYDT